MQLSEHNICSNEVPNAGLHELVFAADFTSRHSYKS
jgi:hypothetical protein